MGIGLGPNPNDPSIHDVQAHLPFKNSQASPNLNVISKGPPSLPSFQDTLWTWWASHPSKHPKPRSQPMRETNNPQGDKNHQKEKSIRRQSPWPPRKEAHNETRSMSRTCVTQAHGRAHRVWSLQGPQRLFGARKQVHGFVFGSAYHFLSSYWLELRNNLVFVNISGPSFREGDQFQELWEHLEL